MLGFLEALLNWHPLVLCYMKKWDLPLFVFPLLGSNLRHRYHLVQPQIIVAFLCSCLSLLKPLFPPARLPADCLCLVWTHLLLVVISHLKCLHSETLSFQSQKNRHHLLMTHSDAQSNVISDENTSFDLEGSTCRHTHCCCVVTATLRLSCPGLCQKPFSSSLVCINYLFWIALYLMYPITWNCGLSFFTQVL